MMVRIIEHDEEGNHVRVEFPDGQMDISVDGIGPSLIGFPLTKLTLFQQRQTAPGEPILREIVACVQIPTATLLVFADQVRITLQSNAESIDSALNQMKTILGNP